MEILTELRLRAAAMWRGEQGRKLSRLMCDDVARFHNEAKAVRA